MPNLEKIHDSITGLDPQFRYPVGYYESPNRVRDAETLKDFHPLLHPYVIKIENNAPQIDSAAPHELKRLQNVLKGETGGMLQSAIRFLELGAMPDESMEATYRHEDATDQADTLSQVGHHGEALKILDALPTPFQDATQAVRARLRSLKALGRFNEALPLSYALIGHYKDSHAHNYGLQFIETAELLVECALISDAEALLDKEREKLLQHYTYYGVRAAIALTRGQNNYAKHYISRAPMLDTCHCYKLIWLRALTPLHPWMEKELLNESGKSRPYEEQAAQIIMCHQIQGYSLCGDHIRARTLADALVPKNIYDPSDSITLLLTWLSVGEFARGRRWASALPRFPSDRSFELIEQTCDLFLAKDDPSRPALSYAPEAPDLSPELADGLRKLAETAKSSNILKPAYAFPQVLVEVWRGSWRARSRSTWIITILPDGRLKRVHWQQAKGARHERRLSDYDPREHFKAQETDCFADKQELAIWLEAELTRNDGIEFGMYCNPNRSLRFNTAAMLRLFQEDELQAFPKLQKCWQTFRQDPYLYGVNAMNFVYNRPTTLENRIYDRVWVQG